MFINARSKDEHFWAMFLCCLGCCLFAVSSVSHRLPSSHLLARREREGKQVILCTLYRSVFLHFGLSLSFFFPASLYVRLSPLFLLLLSTSIPFLLCLPTFLLEEKEKGGESCYALSIGLSFCLCFSLLLTSICASTRSVLSQFLLHPPHDDFVDLPPLFHSCPSFLLFSGASSFLPHITLLLHLLGALSSSGLQCGGGDSAETTHIQTRIQHAVWGLIKMMRMRMRRRMMRMRIRMRMMGRRRRRKRSGSLRLIVSLVLFSSLLFFSFLFC